MSAPRILVVDDDPAILRMIQRVLQSAGFEVDVAADGLEALTLVDEGFDALVLDLQMPRMDGAELYRTLHERGYRLPVLVLSAYGAERAARALGAAAGMSKPFDIDQLVGRVQSIIGALDRVERSR